MLLAILRRICVMDLSNLFETKTTYRVWPRRSYVAPAPKSTARLIGLLGGVFVSILFAGAFVSHPEMHRMWVDGTATSGPLVSSHFLHTLIFLKIAGTDNPAFLHR